MLLKNLSYLFKAFDQSGDLNFFSSQVHQFVFVLFYNILSIYKTSDYLESTVFLVCSICNASQNNKILTQQIGTIFSKLLRC